MQPVLTERTFVPIRVCLALTGRINRKVKSRLVGVGVAVMLAGCGSRSGGVTVAFNDGALDAPAGLLPGAVSAASVGGRIEGHVKFIDAQGEHSCSANPWVVERRWTCIGGA